MESNDMGGKRLDRIGRILGTWLHEGERSKVLEDGRHFPFHPEFVSRKTGDWKGWVDFLANDTEEHRELDDVEAQA